MSPELTHAVQAAEDKKAQDIVVLDLRTICDFADYLVICHGSSARQVLAISEAIEERLREAGIKVGHVEGRRNADWVLMDYIDFVVHVFLEDKRRFYGLERLWGDAKVVPLPGVSSDSAPAEPTQPGASV